MGMRSPNPPPPPGAGFIASHVAIRLVKNYGAYKSERGRGGALADLGHVSCGAQPPGGRARRSREPFSEARGTMQAPIRGGMRPPGRGARGCVRAAGCYHPALPGPTVAPPPSLACSRGAGQAGLLRHHKQPQGNLGEPQLQGVHGMRRHMHALRRARGLAPAAQACGTQWVAAAGAKAACWGDSLHRLRRSAAARHRSRQQQHGSLL